MQDTFIYGITPLSKIDAPYVWLYQDEEKAVNAAIKLGKEHNVDFAIFRITGYYKREVTLVPPGLATPSNTNAPHNT